tara:strand:+ start:563 stop:868 length:306 start_codon:yes stop_codon:yes gene_type:complete
MTQLNNPVYTALCSLCGGAYFVMEGDDAYENIVKWLVETPPTKTQVEAEVLRLQAEYDNNEYQRQRAVAYPSIADQLDTIYHSGIDAWKLTITAVKEEVPK